MKARAKLFALLCIAGLTTTSLEAVATRSAAAQQPSLCTQLVQGIGRLVYNAAYPLATYEGTTCDGVRQRSGGTEYRFRVNGRGIWQNAPLWTDVVFTTDSAGQFLSLNWGNHNSPWWPPGSTFTVTAEAIGEFNAALDSRTTGSAGAVCIRNPTNYRLSYRYRWGSGNWTTTSIEPRSAYRHWWNYAAGSQTSPTFRVEFDNNMTSGYTPTSYNLPRNIVSDNFSCDDASEYAFSIQNRRIDMYKLSN
ncbi:MAG: hypothetical protein AAFU53_16640 [Cyanobacteria bacterium J06632_3]